MSDTSIERLVEENGTLPSARGPVEARRHRNGRRVVLAALFAFVLAGLFGFLGVRMGTTEATAGGWTLRVQAPQISRPALDAPVEITVTRERVIDDPVRLRIDRALFDHIDANLIAPAPSAETGDATYVEWTFDPPARGNVLTVTLDARLSPTEMPGIARLGFALIERGEVVVEVRPRLLRLP